MMASKRANRSEIKRTTNEIKKKREYMKEYMRKYYEKNREKMIEKQKEWNHENREKVNKYQRKHRKENLARVRAYFRNYNAEKRSEEKKMKFKELEAKGDKRIGERDAKTRKNIQKGVNDAYNRKRKGEPKLGYQRHPRKIKGKGISVKQENGGIVIINKDKKKNGKEKNRSKK